MRVATMPLLALVVGALAVGAPLAAQHRQKNVLTAEEIYQWKANMSTAYDAVSMMRPHWLKVRELSRLPGRPEESLQGTQVNVYLNNQNMGSAEFLKTIPLENFQFWLRKTVPGPGRSIATRACSRPVVSPPCTTGFPNLVRATNSRSKWSGL